MQPGVFSGAVCVFHYIGHPKLFDGLGLIIHFGSRLEEPALMSVAAAED